MQCEIRLKCTNEDLLPQIVKFVAVQFNELLHWFNVGLAQNTSTKGYSNSENKRQCL